MIGLLTKPGKLSGRFHFSPELFEGPAVSVIPVGRLTQEYLSIGIYMYIPISE